MSNLLFIIMLSFHVYLVPLQCDRIMSLDSYFEQMNAGPVKVAWLGSGCSVATEATAEVSHYFNIAQVKHHFTLFDATYRTGSSL